MQIHEQLIQHSERKTENAINCQYVCDYYGVPAQIGRRVIVSGKPGIIAEDRGHYIGVNFDEDKPNLIYNVHPTDNVLYGELGQIRKLTRSQQRYRDYLRSESELKFGEWIKYQQYKAA